MVIYKRATCHSLQQEHCPFPYCMSLFFEMLRSPRASLMNHTRLVLCDSCKPDMIVIVDRHSWRLKRCVARERNAASTPNSLVVSVELLVNLGFILGIVLRTTCCLRLNSAPIGSYPSPLDARFASDYLIPLHHRATAASFLSLFMF